MPARPPLLATPNIPRRFVLPQEFYNQSDLLLVPPRRRASSTRKRIAQPTTFTAYGFQMITAGADVLGSDDEADLSPKAREECFDTTCPLFEYSRRRLRHPIELSPNAPSVPAETATDILEQVPWYFECDTDTDDYKILWKCAGALDHRFVAFHGPRGVLCKELPQGEHNHIPLTVSAVVTRLVKPLIYPIGCPIITADLLRKKKNYRTSVA